MVSLFSIFFFFNDTATTEIYTLSLHDALPIYLQLAVELLLQLAHLGRRVAAVEDRRVVPLGVLERRRDDELRHRVEPVRSEEHTSELQSRQYLVCRLLLEKKKT